MSHCSNAIYLTQSQYITSILTKTNMSSAKPCKTPMQSGVQLSKFTGVSLSDPHQFRMTVDALQYVTLTRPDIAFAVNKVSQFMAAPTDAHWQAVKRILHYLKGTLNHGIQLHKSNTLTLNAYSDADWVGCPDDHRSTSGYDVFLGKNIISWSSKKQRTVARSSTEAEYMSMVMATSEIVWLQSLLSELGVALSSPPNLWCDNLGATFLAANLVFHAQTKHIELDFHFVREYIAQGKLMVQFLYSADQIADIFTKPLPFPRFKDLTIKLTVSEDPSRLREAVESQEMEELEKSSSAKNGQDC